MTFDEIYETYRPRIVRYLARLTGEAEAEDLAQEAFVKVSRSMDEFRGDSQVLTWIYRIATNVALDRLRKSSLRIIETVEDVDTISLPGPPRPGTVEQQAIREEMSTCVRGVVDRLPGTYRTAILLGDIEGFKDAEIADIMGLSLGAAKITLHRARVALRRELSECCIFYRNDENELSCDLKGAKQTGGDVGPVTRRG
jgi:RNA polymerase sigma-70 factor (ECF subfamily)